MAYLLERLLFLFLVISVIRSAVQFVYRMWSGGGRSVPATRAARPPAGSSAASETTVLHQDPVCGTYVATESSLKKIVNGQVFHFCSAECRSRYAA
jgi:YHS domain-containing protein